MEAVNLLPAYARPAHRWAAVGKDLSARRVLAAGGAVAGAAAILLGGVFVHQRSVVNDRTDTLARVESELAAAETKAAPLRAIENAATAKRGVVSAISEQRIPWENVLRDLAHVLPSKVQLQTLEVASPTPAATANSSATTSGSSSTTTTTTTTTTITASTGFTVTGSATSQYRVALVLDRLALLPWLSGVTLQSSTRGGGSGGTTGADEFSISANFDPTGVTR